MPDYWWGMPKPQIGPRFGRDRWMPKVPYPAEPLRLGKTGVGIFSWGESFYGFGGLKLSSMICSDLQAGDNPNDFEPPDTQNLPFA
jgi:hypothetical protein